MTNRLWDYPLPLSQEKKVKKDKKKDKDKKNNEDGSEEGEKDYIKDALFGKKEDDVGIVSDDDDEDSAATEVGVDDEGAMSEYITLIKRFFFVGVSSHRFSCCV